MPQIIRGLGFGVVAVGFIAAIPYVCGAIAMMLWARLSDKGGERSWFVASALLLGAVSLVACSYATSSAPSSVVALCRAVLRLKCYQSTFWPIPSSFHRQRSRRRPRDDSRIGTGGFVGPCLIGVTAVDRPPCPDLGGRISHPGRHPDPSGWRQSAATGGGG
jgi:MFS family permease